MVARHVRDVEAPGSSPGTPTTITPVCGSSPLSSTQRDDFYLTLPSGIQILGIEDWVDRIAAEVAA